MTALSRLSAVVVIVIAGVTLTACRGVWQGFVYPDKNDLSEHIGIGNYATLEECRASAVAALRTLKATERGDYECGYSCKPSDTGSGINVCETTER